VNSQNFRPSAELDFATSVLMLQNGRRQEKGSNQQSAERTLLLVRVKEQEIKKHNNVSFPQIKPNWISGTNPEEQTLACLQHAQPSITRGALLDAARSLPRRH